VFFKAMKLIGFYVLATCLAVTVLVVALQLWKADLRVPLYYRTLEADAGLTLVCVKSCMQYGWYHTNSDLGAPGTMDLHDFPLLDSFHFAIIKIMGLFTKDSIVVMNLFYLAGYPLALLTSLFVLRSFRVSVGVSLAASLLFAFLPYHFWRGTWHLFLAAYFMIPLATMVVLWIARGDDLFFQTSPTGKDRFRPTLKGAAGLLIFFIISVTGIYYTFFTGLFLAVVGLIDLLRRTRLSTAITVLILGSVLVISVGLQSLPFMMYRRQHGKNLAIAQRDVYEARFFSLDIGKILVPTLGHRIPRLRLIDRKFPLDDQEDPVLERVLHVSETYYNSLGLLGNLGFLVLLCSLLGFGAAVIRKTPELEDLALLNFAALILGVSGGIGTMISYVVLPEIRCYNRIAIFIAFFSLFAVAIVADRIRQRFDTTKRGRLGFLIALTLVTVGGLCDQIPGLVVPSHSANRTLFDSDAQFVRIVEASVPDGSRIFQLPFVEFPEVPVVHKLGYYGEFRPYFHSRHLRWSFGAVKGREVSAMLQQAAALKPEQMLIKLREQNFAGIMVHRDGYEDAGKSIESALERQLGHGPIVSSDGEMAFFRIASDAVARQASGGL